MKKSTLFALWGFLFALCAALGFVPEPEGTLRAVLTAASLLFFLPPALLLKNAGRETAALIRNLSFGSLLLTSLLLTVNFLGAFGPEWLGNLLHGLLTVVSSPMVCSGCWALSLFLWACLLMVCRKKAR